MVCVYLPELAIDDIKMLVGKILCDLVNIFLLFQQCYHLKDEKENITTRITNHKTTCYGVSALCTKNPRRPFKGWLSCSQLQSSGQCHVMWFWNPSTLNLTNLLQHWGPQRVYQFAPNSLLPENVYISSMNPMLHTCYYAILLSIQYVTTNSFTQWPYNFTSL